MADNVKFSVTVVWAEELRAASLALMQCFDNMKNKEVPEKECSDSIRDALQACGAALLNISPESAIIVCEGTAEKFVPREITVTRAAKQDEPKEPRQ